MFVHPVVITMLCPGPGASDGNRRVFVAVCGTGCHRFGGRVREVVAWGGIDIRPDVKLLTNRTELVHGEGMRRSCEKSRMGKMCSDRRMKRHGVWHCTRSTVTSSDPPGTCSHQRLNRFNMNSSYDTAQWLSDSNCGNNIYNCCDCKRRGDVGTRAWSSIQGGGATDASDAVRLRQIDSSSSWVGPCSCARPKV